MSKIIILAPRLDVPFKNLGPIPEQRGSIPPIREHWKNYVTVKTKSLEESGHTVEVIEKPLWQFTEEFVSSLEYDWIFIPHREYHSLPAKNAVYYMQSVFPWRFYQDTKGFAGGMSNYPIDDKVFLLDSPMASTAHRNFYANYLRSGKSKFDQPSSGKLQMKDYVLFTCQIPHDQTIMYHSEVSVITALRATLEAAKQNGQTVLVKGHPVNPSAMIELQSLTREYPNAVWMDDVSILDAIENSKCVVTVNSGTGMEALALGKSVLVFGRCEYDCVAMKTNPGKIQNDLKNLIYNHTDVVRFFEFWDRMTFDTTL